MYLRNAFAGLVAGPAFYCAVTLWAVQGSSLGNAVAQTVPLPVQQLTVDSHRIQAEIAADAQTRSAGLMYRTSLPSDTGMLFVFDSIGQPCFWMKNTPLPLSIAFIDHQGYIVNIADMEPHSTKSHCPAAPIRYALEMEQGWFESKEIIAGARVRHLPPPN